MIIDAQAIITGCTVVGIVGAIGAVAKHISNDEKHPNKKDIVFKEVCEAKEDCVESEIKNVSVRLDSMDKKLDILIGKK